MSKQIKQGLFLGSPDYIKSCGLDPASTQITEAAWYEAEDESESRDYEAEDWQSRPRVLHPWVTSPNQTSMGPSNL